MEVRVNDRIEPLSKFISDKLESDEEFKPFKEVFDILDHHFAREDQRSNNIKEKTEYFDSLEEERIPEMRCLSCSPFFVEEMNIHDP